MIKKHDLATIRASIQADIDRLTEVLRTLPQQETCGQPWHKWSQEQLEIACKNVGVDITCGCCAAAFFTGITLGETHDPHCKTEKYISDERGTVDDIVAWLNTIGRPLLAKDIEEGIAKNWAAKLYIIGD